MIKDEKITICEYTTQEFHVLHIRQVYISILPKNSKAKWLLNIKYLNIKN